MFYFAGQFDRFPSLSLLFKALTDQASAAKMRRRRALEEKKMTNISNKNLAQPTKTHELAHDLGCA